MDGQFIPGVSPALSNILCLADLVDLSFKGPTDRDQLRNDCHLVRAMQGLELLRLEAWKDGGWH